MPWSMDLFVQVRIFFYLENVYSDCKPSPQSWQRDDQEQVKLDE